MQNFQFFKSVFVPMFSCGHESQVTTEKILSKEQTAEMRHLRNDVLK